MCPPSSTGSIVSERAHRTHVQLEIQWAADFERENGMSWTDLLKGRTGAGNTCTIRRLILGAGTQAMQQLAGINCLCRDFGEQLTDLLGINVTSYYLPTVLVESVKLENSMARLLAACNSVSYLLFSLIGIPNVERWGRRKMMMYAARYVIKCDPFIPSFSIHALNFLSISPN